MATQLILTVGTNALPVWVAWHHLKDKLEQPVSVRFVHTENTESQMESLKDYCTGADFNLDPIQTDSGDLSVVRDDIERSIFKDFGEGTLHVHYTGGTKVMGVETVSAIESVLRQNGYSLETSYLDPRGDNGPRIVSRSEELVPDTRIGIPVEPGEGEPEHIALERIAKLNGFELGEFEHRYRIGRERHDYVTCPPPGIPTDEQLSAGNIVLGAMCDNTKRNDFQRIFSNQRSLWNQVFKSKDNKFVYPNDQDPFTLPDNAASIWQDYLFPVLNTVYPNCPWDIGTGTLQYDCNRTATNEQNEVLEQMDGFFNGIWLEYAAYDAFKKVLKNIAHGNSDRGNYKLFHSVYVRRANPMDMRVRPFELDVVAVLGHQIVVISCTTSRNAGVIKQKGIEAYHRAKQLGGDEARAIVLCNADPIDQPFFQDELQDETGSRDVPIQVWGWDVWPQLNEEFIDYLKTLEWE